MGIYDDVIETVLRKIKENAYKAPDEYPPLPITKYSVVESCETIKRFTEATFVSKAIDKYANDTAFEYAKAELFSSVRDSNLKDAYMSIIRRLELDDTHRQFWCGRLAILRAKAEKLGFLTEDIWYIPTDKMCLFFDLTDSTNKNEKIRYVVNRLITKMEKDFPDAKLPQKRHLENTLKGADHDFSMLSRSDLSMLIESYWLYCIWNSEVPDILKFCRILRYMNAIERWIDKLSDRFFTVSGYGGKVCLTTFVNRFGIRLGYSDMLFFGSMFGNRSYTSIYNAIASASIRWAFLPIEFFKPYLIGDEWAIDKKNRVFFVYGGVFNEV